MSNVSGVRIICVTTGGPTYKIKDRSGNEWKFEFSDMFGPTVLGKRGDPTVIQPGQYSKFWPAFEKWLKVYRASKV